MQYSTLHNVDISIAFDKLPNTTMQSIQRCAISGKCNENNYNPFFSILQVVKTIIIIVTYYYQPLYRVDITLGKNSW